MTDIVHGDYKFGCPAGEWTARLDGRKWGKAVNVVLYFTNLEDGERYWLSAFQANSYGPKDQSFDFSKEQVGSVYKLTTGVRRDKPQFLSAEKIDPDQPTAPRAPLPGGPKPA